MLGILDRAFIALAAGAALSFTLAVVFWVIARRSARRDQVRAVVSEEEAGDTVYPYVYVNDVGAVRELSEHERQYLQTPFAHRDEMRPYVKSAYDERNLAGTLRGYCSRRAIPRGVRIAYPPIEIPRAVPRSPQFVPPSHAPGSVLARKALY